MGEFRKEREELREQQKKHSALMKKKFFTEGGLTLPDEKEWEIVKEEIDRLEMIIHGDALKRMQEKTKDCSKFAKRLSRVVDLFEGMLRSGRPEELNMLEEQLEQVSLRDFRVFGTLALDENYRISVRALAARQYVGDYLGSEQIDDSIYQKLKHHTDPMIREGVVYGADDADRLDVMDEFLEDPDKIVRETAKEFKDR